MSEIDHCLFMKGNILMLIYVDDAIIVLPKLNSILQEINSLKKSFINMLEKLQLLILLNSDLKGQTSMN